MKKISFNHLIIIILLLVSVIFFTLQQILFHDIRESEFLFLQDLMFMPVEILLVTFILDKIVKEREKKERLSNLNILISSFFGETGIFIIKSMNKYIQNIKDLSSLMDIDDNLGESDFKTQLKRVMTFEPDIKVASSTIANIKADLVSKKNYIVSLFANPSLLELDTFSNMLLALYHLIDELENRHDIASLPDTDLKHLQNDILRMYKMLILEWAMYLHHLKTAYPYLYSLALRKNPFSENKSVILLK